MTVVDVGANIGAFSLIAAAEVGANGTAIAFEPEANNFSITEKNLKTNSLKNRL